MTLLPWLPEHPDFSGAMRAARGVADAGERLRAAVALSHHARDAVATGRLDRLAGECLGSDGESAAAAGLTPLRLAILSSHSVDHLAPAIRVAGLDRRLALGVHVGHYGLYRQALLAGDAELSAFAPQLILLALDSDALLPPLPLSSSAAEADAAVDGAVADLRRLWRAVRDRFGAQPIQQTLIAPSPPLVGSNEGLLAASPVTLCAHLNQRIRAAARDDGVLLVDIAAQMPAAFGDAQLFDPVRWHQAKQLINPVFAPLYGDQVARVAAAVAGLSRKCLVLDLDNTLWGGVIGDDGLEGIKLGQGSAEGEAYLAFQRYAARLAERGVILAVCSKNDHAVAQAAFEQHPEMAIAYPDIACFMANWTDKAANLREIARRINIGLDSLVFVDDNPAEREIIRRELPDVAVVELPDDVAYYPARVAMAGYFEAVSLTADDLSRGRSYAENAQRAAAVDTATDMDGFLDSLAMTLAAGPISAVDRPRAAQLINKSNQFNLTTRRRTEQELASLLSEPGTLGYAFRLRDRFGDNGLISVVLARPDEAWGADELLIDTWLMSCRVLGRGVEAASLGVLAEAAAQRNVSALIGTYQPSGRNGMVESHYDRLGFEPIDAPAGSAADARFWRLAVAGVAIPNHHILLETSP